MRSKLENPILTLRLDLHLSDLCKSTRSHLISHLKDGPWDIPREFENELASNVKIFALKETDTTLCMSLKKILNALQNAQAGFSTVENIDITSSRSTAQIGKDLFREVYTNIDQVFDAIHEINHLVPEMKSLFLVKSLNYSKWPALWPIISLKIVKNFIWTPHPFIKWGK